jgi:GNAT superfamily N-acetyltransferase
MEGLSLRPARLGEGPALERLQRRASAADPAFEEVLRTVPDVISLPEDWIEAGRVVVAERDGEILGFAVVLDHGGRVELEGLFVEPAAWRSGVGTALVGGAAAMAREAGAKFLEVIGNPLAEGFYLARGFELLGRRRLRFGTGLVMRLPL